LLAAPPPHDTSSQNKPINRARELIVLVMQERVTFTL